MACGQSLAAVRSGMAECTPNLRASYDAADTTPRSSGRPPTTTAFPFSDGSASSSTETKKASISTWKMLRGIASLPLGRIFSMSDLGKLLMVFGAVLLVAGLLLTFAGRMNLPLGRLPGDIVYRGKNTVVYFPLATSILISIVLSLVFYLAGHFRR